MVFVSSRFRGAFSPDLAQSSQTDPMCSTSTCVTIIWQLFFVRVEQHFLLHQQLHYASKSPKYSQEAFPSYFLSPTSTSSPLHSNHHLLIINYELCMAIHGALFMMHQAWCIMHEERGMMQVTNRGSRIDACSRNVNCELWQESQVSRKCLVIY